MTLTVFTQLPKTISVGATVTYTDDTNVTPSEGGINARKSLRGIIRNYMCSITPKDADEVEKIVMSHLGRRYPFAMRDLKSYQYTNETLAHTTTVASLQKTWTPSTGTRSYVQRVLIADETDVATVVKVNGVTKVKVTDWNFIDYGKIQFVVPILLADVVTATGQFLTPVVLGDNASATLNSTFSVFQDVRLNEIFEAELIALLS